MKRSPMKENSKKQTIKDLPTVVSNLKTTQEFEKFAKRISVVLSLLAN